MSTPIRHLSARVPWHDAGWSGIICNKPAANSACLVLKTCAEKKKEAQEEAIAGKSLQDLEHTAYPPCLGERATFMSPFPIERYIKHPYVTISPETHGHLKQTLLRHPPYAAACVPYRWMRKEATTDEVGAEFYAEYYGLDFDTQREPKLRWEKTGRGWVQEFRNQKALLNAFFEGVSPQHSLIFFYAKQVPFYEGSGRVLVGIGRIQHVLPSDKYEGSDKYFAAAYWETMVVHSIRPSFDDGFLLPYQDAIRHATENPDFDPATLAVVVPEDKRFEFSYGTEHVSNDSAIRVLLECARVWEVAEKAGVGQHHQKALQWIHDEVARIEKLRGYYPGMGAALCALNMEKGHFIAATLIHQMEDPFGNPWTLFEKAIQNPAALLGKELAKHFSAQAAKLYSKWQAANPVSPRLRLLHLLSRFDLTPDQVAVLFIEEEREQMGILHSDAEILANPYLIYEALLRTNVPIAFSVVDMGLFLKGAGTENLSADSTLTDANDPRRLRALTVQQLEVAAAVGHTLLPRKELVRQLRALSLRPRCEVNSDYYELAEEGFGTTIQRCEMADGSPAYQLDRFTNTARIIRKAVLDRLKGARHTVPVDWDTLLQQQLPQPHPEEAEAEALARREKAAALQEVAESRISVLIGPAGTGKTTLLTMLSSLPTIADKGVLLLAPTGKARVRMEELNRNSSVTAKTLAQFLYPYHRYNGRLQQYCLTNQYCEDSFDTIILDECSMLTEEMLATTLDCIRKVAKRVILVGDHRQLPPIGAGRPFVDIVHQLKKDLSTGVFPVVGKGFAELTIKRRQSGKNREDLLLADWFGGGILDAGADEIFERLRPGYRSNHLRFVSFKDETDFGEVFAGMLEEELKIDATDICKSFAKTLGSEDGWFFNFRMAVWKAEAWQVLSPIRERAYGVRAINRAVQKKYRAEMVAFAASRSMKVPKSVGLEGIIYGDKVINLSNHRRKEVWPEGSMGYVANGEIGTVVGQFKTSKMTFTGPPKNVEVEFASQKGYKYTFKPWDFSEEGESPLELAYALTVHKSQGSEFGTVFLVIPNPCFLLTREMLYTALTRQKERVIILYQGNGLDLKGLSSPVKSDTLRRITNLFSLPSLLEDSEGIFLEKNLIHQASDGQMLRSKSELLIYQRLLDKQLNPLYEKKLLIKDVEKLPDFTIESLESGTIYYWEHCGMMHDAEYKERWERKLNWYLENNILPIDEGGGENGTLIISSDRPMQLENGQIAGAISIKEIDALITQAFE